MPGHEYLPTGKWEADIFDSGLRLTPETCDSQQPCPQALLVRRWILSVRDVTPADMLNTCSFSSGHMTRLDIRLRRRAMQWF